MAFDCYCAICGVGFSGMHIESPSQTPLDRRRKWIERRSRALKTGEDITNASRDEEQIHSYDPRIVDADNLSWTSKVHCLGLSQDDKGRKTPFISGPGYYADDGELAVKIGNPQKRAYFNCYGFGTDEAGPVMPFHWCCFELLLRTLTGDTQPKNVNVAVLYDVMSSLCNGSGSSLDLDYGRDVLRAQGQYWQCIPGAEYCVRHPTDTPNLRDFIQSEIQMNTRLRTSPTELSLENRQPKSPFSNLPVEMIYRICSFLPGGSLKALTQASLFVHLITEDDYFWKQVIQMDMPWFWELLMPQSGLELPIDLSYKAVYLWLNEITAPRYGMDDPVLMGVANRRRIWGVCEQLAARYFNSLTENRSK